MKNELNTPTLFGQTKTLLNRYPIISFVLGSVFSIASSSALFKNTFLEYILMGLGFILMGLAFVFYFRD